MNNSSSTLNTGTPRSSVFDLARKFDAKSWKIKEASDFANPTFFTPPQSPIKGDTNNGSWCNKSPKTSSFSTPVFTTHTPVKSKAAGRHGFFTPSQSPAKSSAYRRVSYASGRQSPSESDFMTPAQSPEKKSSNKISQSWLKRSEAETCDLPSLELVSLEDDGDEDDDHDIETDTTMAKDNEAGVTTTLEETAVEKQKNVKKNPVWEFGKEKKFTRPSINNRTNEAAIEIQRVARGGWQRLKFQIAWLQDKLDRESELTACATDTVWDKLQKRKDDFFQEEKIKEEYRSNKMLAQIQSVAHEGQEVIDYLRRDNKKIRAQNEAMLQQIREAKHENKYLQEAADKAAGAIDEINKHLKNFQETHDLLSEVEPNLERKVEEALKSVEIRQLYYRNEYVAKVRYMKCLAQIVTIMESRCVNQPDLVEEIVGYCLAL